MRRLTALLLAALLCLSLAGCGAKGNISRVRLEQGASETLERAEIRAAMDAAMTAFEKHCGGMTLLSLRYDEAYSLAWVTAQKAAPETETEAEAEPETLVLLASYRDEDGKNHTGVPWVLTRDSGGKWKAGDLK